MKNIKTFLEKIIAEGNSLKELERKASSTTSSREEYDQRRIRWMRNCYDVLTYSELTDYWKPINKIAEGDMTNYLYSSQIAKIIGLLQSATDAIDQGFVGKLRYLLHAEMFDSYLDQAIDLLANEHKIPAAVLGRIVLENWLRDQAQKAGISTWETEKASLLNDGLKKTGIFSVPKWRQIQTYLDVGNSAAHGKDLAFNDSDVKQMIDFAKVNCV